MSENIVIIGGGIGGIVAANKLHDKLSSRARITLIERNETHTFAASYLWMMVGQRKGEDISVPLRSLVNKDVNLVLDEVTRIDTSNQRIETAYQTIDYDYLILATGAALDKKFLNRAEEDIHDFYSFEGARNLKDALNEIGSGEIVIAI